MFTCTFLHLKVGAYNFRCVENKSGYFNPDWVLEVKRKKKRWIGVIHKYMGVLAMRHVTFLCMSKTSWRHLHGKMEGSLVYIILSCTWEKWFPTERLEACRNNSFVMEEKERCDSPWNPVVQVLFQSLGENNSINALRSCCAAPVQNVRRGEES